MTVTASAEPTQGTDTSQYLEERKSNETPQVAASERGRAQTEPGNWVGVVGPPSSTTEASGSTWEGTAQRVRPPYTKAEVGWRYPEYLGARASPWEARGTIL